MKRAIATATRMVGNGESTGNRGSIATATRVVGVEEGNDEGSKGNGDGDGNKEGNGNQRRHHGQWLRQRGWQANNGGNNGNGDRDGTKDMAAHTAPGERRMMVVMGHGLCVCLGVCGETTKNKEESKIVNDS